jgi:predicted Zn-dependent peptidase
MRYPTPKRTVLPNGIRIVTVPMPESPTVTVMVLVEAGSRYESSADNGISHFLEHMCFKGTSKRPTAADLSRELEKIGAEHNAFTSDEMTGYWSKARVKHFKEILDVVSDMYLDPLLPETEIEKERGVIIEEINMYEDLPQQAVHRLLDVLMYGDQPAGRSILGPKENIKRFSRRDFIRYRTLHYTSPKTAVIIAGGLTHKEMLGAARKAFGNAAKGKAARRRPTKEKQAAPAFTHGTKEIGQTHLAIGFRSLPLGNKHRAALGLLATILGKGMSSRLSLKLREEMGVCYYVNAGQQSMTDTGVFKIGSGIDTRRLEEVVGVIMDELRKIRDVKVPADELAKAKEIWLGSIAMGLETSDAVADWYSDEILHQPLETPLDIIKRVQQVSAEEIQKMAQEIFTDKRLNVALVGPKRDLSKLKKVAHIL